MGIAAGLLMLVVHEVLGHSLATILMGAHLVHLTIIDSSRRGPASPIAMPVIAGAGITGNIVVGCMVLCAAGLAPATSPKIQYFAWLFGHATLFMGSSYLAGFAFCRSATYMPRSKRSRSNWSGRSYYCWRCRDL